MSKQEPVVKRIRSPVAMSSNENKARVNVKAVFNNLPEQAKTIFRQLKRYQPKMSEERYAEQYFEQHKSKGD